MKQIQTSDYAIVNNHRFIDLDVTYLPKVHLQPVAQLVCNGS